MEFLKNNPEKLLKLILDSIPVSIFWKDVNSTYVGCNEQFARDAGLNHPNEIEGKTDYDLAWKKSESDFFVEVDKRVMNNRLKEIGIVEPQLQADGQDSWLETNKVPLINEKDEVIGILGTYKNITAKIKSEEALKKYAQDLKFKNQELEQFAYIAAHDLQEPLKTMCSFMDYFEDTFHEDLDDNGMEVISRMKGLSLRMQGLIQGLLEYARIGSEMSRERLEVKELLERVLLNLADVIEKSGTIIDIGEMPVIYGSRMELESLFQNLLSNAIKFVNPGTIPHISVIAECDEDYCCFSIEDNGIGISEDYQDKVYLIYQRLNKRSEYPGAGIGLTHAKKIVELHGGEIWHESSSKGGTIFRLKLPNNGNTA